MELLANAALEEKAFLYIHAYIVQNSLSVRNEITKDPVCVYIYNRIKFGVRGYRSAGIYSQAIRHITRDELLRRDLYPYM